MRFGNVLATYLLVFRSNTTNNASTTNEPATTTVTTTSPAPATVVDASKSLSGSKNFDQGSILYHSRSSIPN